MCDQGTLTYNTAIRFLVDTPEIRALIRSDAP